MAIGSTAYAIAAKTTIGSTARIRPSSAKDARTRRVSPRRTGKRGSRREMIERRAHSARAAQPKMSANANAASAHKRRAAVSETWSLAQLRRRGASTTIAAPASISPEKASTCCVS